MGKRYQNSVDDISNRIEALIAETREQARDSATDILAKMLYSLSWHEDEVDAFVEEFSNSYRKGA